MYLNMEPEDSNWNGARGMVTDYLKSDYIEKNKLEMKDCQGYSMWATSND